MPSLQELDLKHLRQTVFKSLLRFSYRFRCEQLKDVSYSLSDGTHLQPLSYDYGYCPWHDFTPSAFESLAETFCWSMMKLPAAARCVEVQHISLRDKRDISQDRETLYILVIYGCHCFCLMKPSVVPSIAYTQPISSSYHPAAEPSKCLPISAFRSCMLL